MQSFGSAYLSPQNKSLAQSFRYMRHKPTIIAFKTPSIEENEPKLVQTNGKTVNPYTIIQAEEGKLPKGLIIISFCDTYDGVSETLHPTVKIVSCATPVFKGVKRERQKQCDSVV